MLKDARSAGSTSWRLALLGLLAICCLLVYTGASAERRLAVSGSTFWPVPVAKAKVRLSPFPDGWQTWVMESDSVYVVDGEGKRTHEPGSWLAAGSHVSELIQTDRPGRAWVISYRADTKLEIQLVEARGGRIEGRTVLEADRITWLREQVSRSPFDVYPDLVPPQDSDVHSYLWVVFSHSGSDMLGLVDPEGRVKPVVSFDTLGVASGTDARNWQVVPLGAGPRAWLKMNMSLFFIDAQAQIPVRGPLLQGEEVLQVVPSSTATRAWVMTRMPPQTGTRRPRRLYSIDATAAPGTGPILLLKGEAIRQMVPDAGGSRLWVAGAIRPETGGSGGLYLIDPQGRQLLPGGPLFHKQGVLIAVPRPGRVWVLTREGDAYVLDDQGGVLAGTRGLVPLSESGEGRFDRLSTLPLGSSDGLLVWGSVALHLQREGGSVRMTPLNEGSGIGALEVEPDGKGAWFQSQADGNLYFTFLSQERYLKTHLVLKATDMQYVFPSRNGENGWIQANTASFAYVHRSRVGAALSLEGGTLKIEEGRYASLQGTLNVRAPLRGNGADSLSLDWPGLAHAAEVGGTLEVTLWDPDTPQSPVASVTRGFEEGAPSPRLNWYLSTPSAGQRTYDIVFRYQDDLGTETQLVVRSVPFHAPLREQIWFRTAIVCLAATLLFALPMVLLPRTRLARRWLPFVSWLVNVVGGSGLALVGLARDLRIHFPTLVGVLLAEMILCLIAGAFSPAMFRLLASTKPFQWLVPLALGLPTTRRRIFRDYVVHVRRKLEAWRRQANDERFVSIPVNMLEGRTGPQPPGGSAAARSSLHLFSTPEERICHFLTRPQWEQSGNVLIESPGGRGKSALLREVVRRMLIAFEEDPSRPLPVLCDLRATALEAAAHRALEATPLTSELHELQLQWGNYVLVMDGLSEASLTPEELQAFIEGRYGTSVRLLLTSRPHLGFRRAIENSACWLHVEPRRLDEETLGRFIAAYAPGSTGALSKDMLRACRGTDGTYLPILVRLALLFGGESGAYGIAALYEAAFRGLLRQQGAIMGEEDSKLLSWASELCLRTYWANGIRSLRFRNAPEQETMQKLLQAGVLVPDDPALKPGQVPSQVRFFHDSMQSYLTARGLFAQEHAAATWDILWRAAADPLFSSAQSEFVSGAGSELFQMCLQVFGPEEKLRRELRRQLLEWAHLHDNDLKKRDIVNAVPESSQPYVEALLHSGTELSPRGVLHAAIATCFEDLASLGTLYMHMAQLLWPLHQPAEAAEGHRGHDGGAEPFAQHEHHSRV